MQKESSEFDDGQTDIPLHSA